VCLVVLGKHTDRLKFIDILLGDDPPLQPEERFYQRLLAGDATDAAEQAEEELKTHTLSAYYDAIPMKALVLAQDDATEGKLSDERQQTIRSTMDEIIEDLDEYGEEISNEESTEKVSGSEKADTIVERLKPAANTSRVLAVASRSPLDQTAASMLVQILIKRGVPAVSLPYDRAVETQLPLDTRSAELICLSYFGSTLKPTHVRFLIRRLRRLMPRATFVACFWMLRNERTKLEEWKTIVNADFAVSSLEEAATICCTELLSTSETSPATDRNEVDKKSARSAA
jgi:hypothetical protein